MLVLYAESYLFVLKPALNDLTRYKNGNEPVTTQNITSKTTIRITPTIIAVNIRLVFL